MNGRMDRRMTVRDEDSIWNMNPYRLIMDMDNIWDRMFRDFGNMNLGPLSIEGRRPEAYIRGPSFMPLDLADNGDRFELRMEMPGLRKENVEITLDKQILTISAKEDEAKEEKNENYMVKERRAFNCRRSIKLPGDVKEDEVKARVEDGVLLLTLPKKAPEEKEGARTINIE